MHFLVTSWIVVTATHTHTICYVQDRLAPDNLHLGCSYHLHSSHSFLSTWGAVMLENNNNNNNNNNNKKQSCECTCCSCFHRHSSTTFLVAAISATISTVWVKCICQPSEVLYCIHFYLEVIGSWRGHCIQGLIDPRGQRFLEYSDRGQS